MYVILLLAIFAVTGAFAVQNEGTQVFTLLGSSWTLPTWVPTAAGVGAVTALLVMVAAYLGLRARLLQIGHGREIERHARVIEDLLAENATLREQVAWLRAEARGANSARPAAPPSSPERES